MRMSYRCTVILSLISNVVLSFTSTSFPARLDHSLATSTTTAATITTGISSSESYLSTLSSPRIIKPEPIPEPAMFKNKKVSAEKNEFELLDKIDDLILNSKKDSSSLSAQAQGQAQGQGQTLFTRDELNSIQANILDKIEDTYHSDLKFCSSFFASEGDDDLITQQTKNKRRRRNPVRYEKIELGSNDDDDDDDTDYSSFLAIRTTDSENPILDKKSIDVIVNTAESTWFQSNDIINNENNKSRFTYQRKGNYEAHLKDLAVSNPQIKHVMDEALIHNIYPTVRNAFCNKREIPDIDEIEFCVYDSLIIRYNATEASSNIAGQPLHRDLGLVSVNIMLNSDELFEGGGTFFEDQCFISSSSSTTTTKRPLKPMGVGQALLHLSSRRHAGAGTTKNTRDILVIFLTAKTMNNNNNNNNNKDEEEKVIKAPRMEKAARLKINARELSHEYYHHQQVSSSSSTSSMTTKRKMILHRVISYRLAIQNVPTDGEAWHYLAMSIREYAALLAFNDEAKEEVLRLTISILKHAHQELTPCDGRLCNNLGLAHETLFDYCNIYHQRRRKQNNGKKENDKEVGAVADDSIILHSHAQQHEIIKYYQKSQFLHQISENAGCDVALDSDMTCLNYGLYLSKQNRWRDAVNVLQERFDDGFSHKRGMEQHHQRIKKDGSKLLLFCKERI